jgi:D-alanyl-D-alanine carboxypeptidase
MTTFTADRRAVSLGLAAFLAACGRKAPDDAPDAAPADAPNNAPDAETIAPPPPRPDPPPAPVRDAGALKALLDAQVAARGVPALAAAYVTPKGVAFSAASGVRRFGSDDRVTTQDVWHIGSNTKAMTAALYARLVEAGLAQWGATLPDLFPDLTLDPAWQAVTIEHLLSHRAGLNDVGVPWVIARRADNRPLPEQRLASTRDWLAVPPPRRVGQFAYANTGYVIAGAAIEAITGKSWEEAIERHVFKPLIMVNRGFGPPPGDAPQGHRGTEAFRYKPAGLGPEADNPLALAPAGCVHIALDDWANFLRVFIDPDQTFLTPEAVTHLTTPAPGADYALGWKVVEQGGERFIAHDGSNTMWLARMMASPAKRHAMLIATNCAGSPAEDAMETISRSLAAA